MTNQMKLKFAPIIVLALCLSSCVNENFTEKNDAKKEIKTPVFQNKAHQLVYEMTQKVGTYSDLLNLKDVSYTYSYRTADGKVDITEEKYIFAGEKSYGKYIKHERTLPEMAGTIEQGFDGTNFWFKNDGKYSSDEEIMKKVIFNRKTNFYWFTMMQKLSDPGLNYELLREEKVDDANYDVVNVTFKDQIKPTDIYILYINKKTQLVDQFLFTVADFGKTETPFLMKVEYEEIDGILIPSNRKYTASTWKGEYIVDNWILVEWRNIKFNAGLTKELFEKQ
jgi:hypothetical protein